MEITTDSQIIKNSEKEKVEFKEALDTLFAKLTNEEKQITCLFPLPEKKLKELCIKKRCAVQGNWANLLNGIENKILLKKPELKDSNKLLSASYKWHRNHSRASKKFYEKQLEKLKLESAFFWKERKISNVISLGIHPKFLTETFNKYQNFDEVNKYIKKSENEIKIKTEFPCKNYINKIHPYSIMNQLIESDSVSDSSLITVINTQESQYNTEDLLGIKQNNYVVTDFQLVFNSEEIIQTSQPSQTYEQFNKNELIVTSTQKDEIE